MSAQDGPPQPAGSRGLRLPRAARTVNPDGRMPLLEHIRELRNRVLKTLLAMTVGAIIGWFIYRPVWHFIEAPYCRLHIYNPVTHSKSCTLFVNGLFDSLFLRLKIAI